jgi:hypothetical protein
MSNHTTINHQVEQLRLLLVSKEIQRPSVSNGSVGWHIAHSILVIIKMITAMEKSDSVAFKSKFSFLKWAMFTFKKIPRGKRKAPATVQPPEQYEANYFDDLFKKVEEKLNILKTIPPNANVLHPALGLINKAEALKFLMVHNKHHLKIIKDILANK